MIDRIKIHSMKFNLHWNNIHWYEQLISTVYWFKSNRLVICDRNKKVKLMYNQNRKIKPEKLKPRLIHGR